MESSDLLADAFGRLPGSVEHVVHGLSPRALNHRPYPEGNSISWLIWHLSRVQDAQVSAVAGQEQVWLAKWADRLGLPLPPADTGYGHTSEQVAKVQVNNAEELQGYFEAVNEQTIAFVSGLTASDLDRVVDTSWDPPVTLGVRLISSLADCLEHVGQAAYVRGMLSARSLAS